MIELMQNLVFLIKQNKKGQSETLFIIFVLVAAIVLIILAYHAFGSDKAITTAGGKAKIDSLVKGFG